MIGLCIAIAFIFFVILVSIDEWVKYHKSNTTIDEHFDSAIKEETDESA